MIEEDIFKKSTIDFTKLEPFGFIKNNNEYQYTKNIFNNKYQIIITISLKGKIKGHIYDLIFNDEYTNYLLLNPDSFALKIKNEYIKTLEDIKNNCFITKLFSYKQTNRIVNFIYQTYHDKPNFEWDDDTSATFKNNKGKWYGLIMNISFNKLHENNNTNVDILNIKLNPEEIITLINQEGFYPAYHMNKKHWITIVLNDTLKDEEIEKLITKSYNLVL